MQGLFGYKKDHIMFGFRNQAEERRLEQSVVYECLSSVSMPLNEVNSRAHLLTRL